MFLSRKKKDWYVLFKKVTYLVVPEWNLNRETFIKHFNSGPAEAWFAQP